MPESQQNGSTGNKGSMRDYGRYETRFCIVSAETGEILDDAQGYGYRTAQKAYAGYAYKSKSKSKKKKELAKKRSIERWMAQNEEFVDLMSDYAFEISKGAMGPDAKFNAELVRNLLKQNELEPDFTAGELLRAWKTRKQ